LSSGQHLFVSHTDHADFILTFAGLYNAPDRAGDMRIYCRSQPCRSARDAN
jgi:hypothetical protein